MIRPELKNFYDTNENINQSLITLNAFTDKFSNNIYLLQSRVDIYCQRYKDSVNNNQSVASEDKAQILQTVDNAFTPFQLSLDSMRKNILQCSVEMTQRAPIISYLLHNFEYLQKERTHVRSKNLGLQSSEMYEREIVKIHTQMNKTLQEYTIEIKRYNDRIDLLQEMITYLSRTGDSFQSLTSNQFILSWDSVLNNFENLIQLIKNDTELFNSMRNSLFAFIPSIKDIQLIKLRELNDIESQMEESKILIENLQKQVSDLSTKNSDLNNTVETLRREQHEIQPLDLINADLMNKNDQLAEQVAALETNNKELQQNRNEHEKQYNDYKKKMEQERFGFEAKIQELENEIETTVLNLNSGHRKKLTKLAREKEKLINEIDQLKKLHDDDNEVNTKLQEQNNEQKKTINDLYFQLDALKRQSKEDFKKREQELLNRVQELRNELSIAELQLKREQAKIENLKVDMQKLDQTNKIQYEKIISMTEELVRNDLHIKEMENKLQTSDQQISVLNMEKQNWNQKEAELQQKYDEKTNENESLKIRIEELSRAGTSTEEVIQAGTSTEVLRTEVSDDNQSKIHLKRKLQSDEDPAKRTKLHTSTSWQEQIAKLEFTDSHVTVAIDNINSMKWNPLRTKIKESSKKLNRLHDKLAAVLKRFKITQKLRTKSERKIISSEINAIIDEIREHLKIEEQHKNRLTDILLEIDINYKKDMELHENSQLIFMNLTDSIRKDYDEEVNSYKQTLSQLTANEKPSTSASELKKITESSEKIHNQLEKSRDTTNTKLKDLQNQIIQFIEKFNERNEKRKKLLFSVQCHIVNNIYSKVKNELLISIDQLIY